MSDEREHQTTDSLLMQPFYDAAEEKRLVLPRCSSCECRFWYPQVTCPHCASSEWAWRNVKPNGSIFSWTVVHHAFSAGLAEAVPFVVGLVELDDAPDIRIVSNIQTRRIDELRIGLAVTATFGAPVGSDHILPIFKLTA